MNIHAGITRWMIMNGGKSWRQEGRGGGRTYYSDEEIRGAIVVQLIFEERDLSIEEDGVRAR